MGRVKYGPHRPRHEYRDLKATRGKASALTTRRADPRRISSRPFHTYLRLGLREIVSVRVGAPLGVIRYEVHNSFDEAPERADTARHDCDDDLPYADVGVSEVEAVYAPTSEENSE